MKILAWFIIINFLHSNFIWTYQHYNHHNHHSPPSSPSSSQSPWSVKNPSILIEGCVDDGCLNTLTKNAYLVSKCFEPLHETLSPDDDDYSIKLCCNIVKYERCLFPYIIFLCGMDSLDKFEAELRSMNSLCSLTTLQWNKCEQNKTFPAENELEIRE